jgi:hypothetical protein
MTPQSALNSKIKKLTVIQQNTVGCRLIFLTENLFEFTVILMLISFQSLQLYIF